MEQSRAAFHRPNFAAASPRARIGSVVALLALAALAAVASTVPLTGSLSGPISGFDICEPEFVSENIGGTVNLQCSQSGSDFQCSGTVTDEDGDTGPITLQGSNQDGNLSGTWSFSEPDDGDSGGGSFSGSFDGGLAQIQLFGDSVECSLIEVFADLNFTPASGDLTVGENSDSGAATSTSTLVTTVPRQVNTISARASNALQMRTRGGRGTRGSVLPTAGGLTMSGETGLNAGEGLSTLAGAWFGYSYSDFDDEFTATAFEAEQHSFLGGLDVSPWEPVLLGLAFGYESADYETTFNAGGQDVDGWTISPYLAASLSETFSVDAVFGYTAVDTEQFRTAAATRVSSQFDADRFFWGGNLNMVKPWGNWYLSARVGFLWAREFQDAFTESDGTAVAERTIKLGQWHVGGEAAYTYGDWEPFAGATYGRDYSRTEVQVAGAGAQPANDRDDVMFALGLRYFHTSGITGALEWNKRLGREDFDEDTVNLLLRMDF